MSKKIKPIHPGEVLLEEFLIPLNISKYRLAKDIDVAPIRIGEIVKGVRSLSVDTALRLGKYFNISPQFWLNLQSQYDLAVESEELKTILSKKVKVFNLAMCNKQF
jgi:addiction module HigA family antidote